MLIERYPRSAWSWRATAGAAAIIAAPLLGAVLLAPELRGHEAIVSATQLVVYPAILGASVLLYVHYRMTESEVVGWLALCLTVYAVDGAALAGLRAADPDLFFSRPGWVLIVDLPVAMLILAAVRCADSTAFRVDPLLAGLLLGLLVASIHVAANTFGPELSMTSPPVIAVEVLLVAVGLAIARAAARLRGIPRWSAHHLSLGTVAIVASHVASFQDGSHVVVSSVAVGTSLVGAVVMVSACAASLRFAIKEQRGSLTSLSDRVAEMELHEHESRARLHEITNSIAGIAVASSLIHRHAEVSPLKRERLEEMLESESGRLARVLGREDRAEAAAPDDAASPEDLDDVGPVELDQVIDPLVTAQRTLGRQVRWHPGGITATCDPDYVAEVVSILLDNAARHAPDSATSISVTRRGDLVEIVVHDDGPGIPPEVRQGLFEWGERGEGSEGQGIGLNVAHGLMLSGGNSLRLENDGAGATFVIGLHAAERGGP